MQHSGSQSDHALLKPKQSLFQLIVQRQSCHVRVSWVLFQPVQQQPKCNYRISVKARWNSYLGFQIPKEAPLQTVAIHILPCQPSKLSGVTRQLIELSSVSFRFSLQINHFGDFFYLYSAFHPLPLQSRQHLTACTSTGLPKPSANIKGWMVDAIALIGTNIKACIFYTPDGCFLNVVSYLRLVLSSYLGDYIRSWELSTSTAWCPASPPDFHMQPLCLHPQPSETEWLKQGFALSIKTQLGQLVLCGLYQWGRVGTWGDASDAFFGKSLLSNT